MMVLVRKASLRVNFWLALTFFAIPHVDRTYISDTVRLQEQLVEREHLAAIGTTAATFAHEMGNPLNSMLMTGQHLERYLAKNHDQRPSDCHGPPWHADLPQCIGARNDIYPGVTGHTATRIR
jgi:hypothetical protein